MTGGQSWRAAFWGAASGALTAVLMLGLLVRADARRAAPAPADAWCVIDEAGNPVTAPAHARPLPRAWRA